MSPTVYSQVLSSLARLLALLKNISEVPKRQVVNGVFSSSSYSSFSQASTIMSDAIRKIYNSKKNSDHLNE